jgi:hypothetical protein
MSKHDNIYNILGKLASLEPTPEPVKKPLTESKASTVSEAMIAEKYMGFKKDAKEKEVGESGLQAYLGKKKYGKEGMQALQKAGREGASKEKMAQIRAKHDKMDESDPNNPDTWTGPSLDKPFPGKSVWPKGKRPGKYNTQTGQVSHWDNRTDTERERDWNTMIEAKPDYIDLDKDGNKKEPMKKAAKDAKKPVKENFQDQHDIENKGEYDQEGDMAHDQLNTIDDAAEELKAIIDSDDNLPEWVQSKITKAMDYLDTARDYLKSNDVNEEMKSWMRDPQDPESKVPAFQRKNKEAGKQAGEKAVDAMNKKVGANVFKSGRANEGTVTHTKTGLIHKGSYGSDYQGSDEEDDDYGSSKSSSGDKKRGRPRIHPAKDPNAPKRPRGRPRKNNESINLDTFVEDTMAELEGIYLGEKAVSKQQQKFMGMVHAMKKGEKVKGASPELKKAAKSMSKADAKDFASTKHKGLPQKVSESMNFVEMMRETDQTVEEMLAELHAELDEYKRSGHMGDKLRDAVDLHRHNKKKIMGETNPLALPEIVAPVESDSALDELAALAGLGQPVVEEPNEGNEFSGARADAIRAGKDTFSVAGKTYKVTDAGDEMNESQCNMSEAGAMCPEHGLKECGMYEASKPDYIDLDKDGNKKEPMKKAAKDAKKVNEDLQADDGEYYDSADDFFGQFEADTFDQEIESDDGMEVRGYIDGVNVMAWRFNDESKTSGYGVYNDDELMNECGMGPMPSQEPESRLSVNTNMSSDGKRDVTVSASGEEAEKLMQLLKLAGLGNKQPEMARPEEMEEEFANEPDEKYASTDVIIRQGNDLNRPKAQYADKPKAGDNPMATESMLKLEGRLAAEYELLKKGK